ncbi:hypothetical protein BDZ90DRAFT_262461 [Jaminaea rosea]|uniref:Uncharacterized protein n=1 Tax=Jaminaea rosea TaxID=1569628 RepID=A0A316UNB9_9BASI|nr:hypothetical protein BDZ90DRAFT_262461 [Jaminaea rosea]PWN25413.1 hypothetical protein BDZ90DRAFT_262461 [Jaminaea rosea]
MVSGDLENTPPAGRRTTTALRAAASALPPSPMVMSIYCGPVLDATGSVVRPEKLERNRSGTIRWQSRAGFSGFKERVGSQASTFADAVITYHDLDVKVEIPGSIYNQRTPASPATVQDYVEMVEALQRLAGRPGRMLLSWTRPPSTQPADTDAPRSSAIAAATPGSGLTQMDGRDPTTSLTDTAAFRVAQQAIEERWKRCDCQGRGERDRRCYIAANMVHYPITPSGMMEWKSCIVYNRATVESPPVSFFDRSHARPRGRYSDTAAGQAVMARNGTLADPARASTSFSGSSTASSNVDSLADWYSEPPTPSRVLNNTTNRPAVRMSGPLMTIYHYNQTFQPGGEDMVPILFMRDVLYMPALARVIGGQGRQTASELGLTPSQLDVCDDWLQGWSELAPDDKEDIGKMRKDLEHLSRLTAAGFPGRIDVSSASAADPDRPLSPIALQSQ